MKKNFWAFGVASLMLAACGGEGEGGDTTDAPSSDSTAVDSTETASEGINPFPDFPAVGLTANEGDYCLTPSLKWQQDATDQGADQVTFIFYNAKMGATGAETSTVDFTFDGEQEIPNYMIIPIKSGQTAKKGDIILTWWQTGSGMQRAIVVDDTDPSAPIVNYLDLDWDNPAKTSDDIGIGQATYQIEAGTFHVLGAMWEPGTTVAVKDGDKYLSAQVVAVSGNKVLTVGWGGSMKMYDKSACTPVPVYPNVKAGDEIQAPWVGSFVDTKVQKVDTKMGRVWCDDPYSDDPMVIPFGEVATDLVIQ